MNNHPPATGKIQWLENCPRLWLNHFPKASANDHKYTRGHVLIYGGYPMTGAARLAARSAARIGAGLVTVAVPQKAFIIYAQSLLSIMVKPLIRSSDFDHLMNEKQFSAFLIGPGAGDKIRAKVMALLNTKKPVVLDADALTTFQENPQMLFKNIIGPCILTPHEGEFCRLFTIKGDKLHRAQAAAKLSNAIIVLKGATTVIAAPDGRVVMNTHAPATLATAGTGDVLSGMITGLLAQHMDPFDAACAAVWLHGEAAKAFGAGLLSEDLPELLPRVIAALQCTVDSN